MAACERLIAVPWNHTARLSLENAPRRLIKESLVRTFFTRRTFNHQKFLTVYSGVLTVAVTAALLSGFTAGETNAKFDTITVQRINVVEPDGTLRLVVTNNRRVPGIIIKGHEYPDFGGRKANTDAGLLFYDAEGTESGGLTFGGRKDAQGNIRRFGHLSFDRYGQDQMFSIDAVDFGTAYGSSIRMNDVPGWPIEEYLQLLERIQDLPPEQREAEIAEFRRTHPDMDGVHRVTLGHERSGDTSVNVLNFLDSSNRERARLWLDPTGAGSLRIKDENGTETRFPPN
jgi:hypothetical protein